MELSDLLSLSRTTKAFRELLLAPEAKRFWTSAMKHSEAAGVPPCPQWLNIIEYANLLYSPHCHVRTYIFIRLLCIDIRICYVIELSRWKYQFHSVNLLRVGRTLLQEMSRQVRRKSKPTLVQMVLLTTKRICILPRLVYASHDYYRYSLSNLYTPAIVQVTKTSSKSYCPHLFGS